jgi:hypothetical protein
MPNKKVEKMEQKRLRPDLASMDQKSSIAKEHNRSGRGTKTDLHKEQILDYKEQNPTIYS